MLRMKRWCLQGLVVGLSACAQADRPVPKETAMPTAIPTPANWPAGLQSILPALLGDAAQRSGVAADRLRVASAHAVTWPDGALGCPQAGRLYTHALVPGWRILITAPGAPTMHYHASARGPWLWCPAERALPALPASPDPQV